MTIPNKELVGKNPRLKDGVYSDDYMAALDQFATVDEVFGKHREAIANGEHVVARLVMGTLGRCEYESHLVSLVMGAAKAGEWRAVVREPGRHFEGLDVVTERHFGHITKLEGKTYLLPSALYIAYCNEKL
ncbi:MAG: hypothetical protein KJ600_03925 [Nanoarchaeota archaeon]|nr:hypothetical protein [Nanoarchaeota archaeon]MBU1103676.1 hypothetical protein [Nanoarchaeota archaeon]